MKRSLLIPFVLALLGGIAAAAPAKLDTAHSIRRTRRTIGSAAYAMKRADEGKRLGELRAAVVHNTAARIAYKKDKLAAAMFLTLEARRVARELLVSYGEGNNVGFEADPAESAAAAGGGGKDAEAAVAEAEKTVPTGGDLRKLFPDDLDQDVDID